MARRVARSRPPVGDNERPAGARGLAMLRLPHGRAFPGLPALPGGRRLALGLALAALAFVALAGVVLPSAAATGPLGGGPSGATPLATPGVPASSGLAGVGADAASIDVPGLVVRGVLVLGLLLLTLRVLHHVQGGAARRGGLLTVLESRPLAAKASLHLVAVGERRLVVGLTPAGIVALGELDASELPDEAAQPVRPSPLPLRTATQGQARPLVPAFVDRAVASVLGSRQ